MSRKLMVVYVCMLAEWEGVDDVVSCVVHVVFMVVIVVICVCCDGMIHGEVKVILVFVVGCP